MSTVLRCNNCEEHTDKNYASEWVTVTVETEKQDYVGHYCAKCWFEMFVRKTIVQGQLHVKFEPKGGDSEG